MPDLTEQDDRGPLAAAAERARVVSAPVGGVGRVLVITGPSGVGKGTLIRALRERLPGLELSVSATTRQARAGEEDGRDYYFLSPDEFEERLRRGDFLEHATYAGHRYGTLRSELERLSDAAGSARPARALVLEIELQGARQVREALPDALQVFVAPPSIDALRERLVARGLDSPQQIEDRLATAREELRARREFPHVIVNDRVDRAADELTGLVASIWGWQPRGASQ